MVSEATTMAPRPIRMQVDQAGGQVAITVIGAVSAACDASYALEVASGGTGSANRSTQRGNARLNPGPPVRLLNVRLGGSTAAESWSSKLTVTGCGPEYEETFTAP